MTYATAADVAALMVRELTTEETALVNRRLAQVERLILRRVPDLADKIEDDEIDLADVVDIEAEAVCRVIRAGDGLVMETEGSYSYTKTREAADNSLRILPDEWILLGVKQSRMFVFTPGIGGVAL